MAGIADKVGAVDLFSRVAEGHVHADNFMFHAAVIILRNHVM